MEHQGNPPVAEPPIGLDARGTRTERDGMGTVEVPADRYWGASTQRAVAHFAIGDDRMPVEVVRAYGTLKAACAAVNARAGRLTPELGELLERVAGEVARGDLDDHFPLGVYQSGSGTQTNQNVNEVIANRARQLQGRPLGAAEPADDTADRDSTVHPNDHVNLGQSSNDTFITAVHLALHGVVVGHTAPALERLAGALRDRSQRWADVVKLGRTHLQDATPLTVGQEWGAFASSVRDAATELRRATDGLLELAVGGTAVGTGLNSHDGFGAVVAGEIARRTGHPFVEAEDHFAAQSTLDRVVRVHAALRGAAVAATKVADDLRWLGSGPRAGLHELVLPANEPGSSIMPGKVNPTQCEALLQVCLRVFGNDVTVAQAAAAGSLQLNTFRPVAAAAALGSARLLGDGADRFREHLVEGVELDRSRIDRYVADSAMLVTALSPHIGYDRATAIAHHATEQDLPLRDAAVALGVDPDLFDRVVDPVAMTRPDPA
ncbi:MAG: class II fumarate hydratase [Microthrixaceae bacterium]